MKGLAELSLLKWVLGCGMVIDFRVGLEVWLIIVEEEEYG